MIKKEITPIEIKQKVYNFVSKHKDWYSEYERNFLIQNATWGINYSFVPDILRQIYDETDLLQEDKNIYTAFLGLLRQQFDINRNLVEVGGGRIPSLAKKIQLVQTHGSITVYDPKLCQLIEGKNLILKKESFTLHTDVSGKDMLIGFTPCEATETLLEMAFQHNLDFMIALSDQAAYGSDLSDYDQWDIWQENILYTAARGVERYGLGTLQYASLEDYDDPYPVIYNKRS